MASTPTPTPQEVLAAAVQMHDHETTAAIAKLQLAVEWVRLHPGEAVDTSVPWGMRDLEIAGDGAPTVDEGAVDEFALAVGLSTDTGRRYLGDAVELCHRLPRIWAWVLAGQVAVWKARRIAQATIALPPAGAAHVDRALYFTARRCSFAEIDRQVDAARREHDPVQAERRRAAAAEQRHFDLDQVTVRPVIDLAEELSTDSYVPTQAMQDQVRLKFPECPFPGCHRPSRPGHKTKRRRKPAGSADDARVEPHGPDLDHLIPYPQGKTTSSNLYPPCRTPPPAQDQHRLDLPVRPRHRIHLDQPPRPPTYQLTPTPPTNHHTAGGVTPMSRSVSVERYGRGQPTLISRVPAPAAATRPG